MLLLQFAYFLLYLVQDLMPCVVSCLPKTSSGYTNEYSAVVESEHPYKQGLITNYCVSFIHLMTQRAFPLFPFNLSLLFLS